MIDPDIGDLVIIRVWSGPRDPKRVLGFVKHKWINGEYSMNEYAIVKVHGLHVHYDRLQDDIFPLWHETEVWDA